MGDASEALLARLGDVQSVFIKAGETTINCNERLRWLRAQLRNIQLQLEHMLLQLESGCDIGEMGLGTKSDFIHMMDELAVEISQLSNLIQVCHSVER